MLAAYLVCLIVGGVFVGLSVLSGLGKDADGAVDDDLGHEHDALEVDHDVDGLDDGLDADDLDGGYDVHDVDGLAELHADHGGGLVGVSAHEIEIATAAMYGRDGEPVDARKPPPTRRRRLPWVPFTSFRFWTFGSAFFGLTGALLTGFAPVDPSTAFVTSLAVGVGVGTATSLLVRALRTPVSGAIARDEHIGAVGELLFTLRPGGISKLRARVRHRERVLLATSAYAQELPPGTRVVVLRIDDDGRALVAPEAVMFAARSGADVMDGDDDVAELAAADEADEEERA